MWWQAHPFSLSRPTRATPYLRLTVKVVGRPSRTGCAPARAGPRSDRRSVRLIHEPPPRSTEDRAHRGWRRVTGGAIAPRGPPARGDPVVVLRATRQEDLLWSAMRWPSSSSAKGSCPRARRPSLEGQTCAHRRLIPDLRQRTSLWPGPSSSSTTSVRRSDGSAYRATRTHAEVYAL